MKAFELIDDILADSFMGIKGAQTMPVFFCIWLL